MWEMKLLTCTFEPNKGLYTGLKLQYVVRSFVSQRLVHLRGLRNTLETSLTQICRTQSGESSWTSVFTFLEYDRQDINHKSRQRLAGAGRRGCVGHVRHHV